MDSNNAAQKLARLHFLQSQEQSFPGRKLGGSGLTGLNSNDAQGYSQMLNEQVERENLEREFGGQSPLNVRQGADMPSQAPSITGLRQAVAPPSMNVHAAADDATRFMAEQRALYEKNYAADQQKKRR